MMYLQKLLTKNAMLEEHKDYDVKYDSVLDPAYTDVTGLISGWYTHGDRIGKDYKFIRKQIQDLSTDFEALSASDKILAAHFMAPDPTTVLNSGVLGSDYQVWKNDWIIRSEGSRVLRWEAAKSLAFDLIANAKVLLSEIINDGLHDKYIEGIESLANDGADGLFDCVESTAIYEGAGLIDNGYAAANPPQTMTEISTLIMDILENGNY